MFRKRVHSGIAFSPEVANDVLLGLGVTPLEPRLLQPVEHPGDGRVQFAKDVLAPLHGHVRVLGAELDGSDVRRAYP